MSKKSKKGGLSSHIADREDVFFEKSPFSCSTMATLEFRQGDPLKIHRGLLDRNPKLRLLDISEEGIWGVEASKHRRLQHISRSAGHVLVQYLYTDTYHTLTWTGPTDNQKEIIAKLRTAFEVYDTAHEYDLEGLVELAREQITVLSKDIDAFIIIDIVKEAYPIAKGIDIWFRTFMKDMIKTAVEKPPIPPRAEKTAADETNATELELTVEEQLVNQGVPLEKILLQGALEVYREKIEALAAEAASNSAPQFGFSATTTTKKIGLGSWVAPAPVVETPDGFWSFDATKKVAGKNIAEPAEPEPAPPQEEDFWGKLGTKKAKKKGGKREEPEPEPEPAPEPELVEEAKPETVPLDEDPWGFSVKKKDKKKKGKNAVVEPELELEPEPLHEEKPAKPKAELAQDDQWATWSTTLSKGKKIKKGLVVAAPELEIPAEPEPEPEPVAELIPETQPETVELDDGWGFSAKKSKKDKKKRKDMVVAEPEPDIPMEPEPEPEPEPESVKKPKVATDPAVSPVEKDWVGDDSDPWTFWGAKKSPRPSM